MSAYLLDGIFRELNEKAEVAELTEDDLNQLKALKIERVTIQEQLGKMTKNLKGETQVLANEIRSLQKRKRAIESNNHEIREILLQDMRRNREKTIKAGTVRIIRVTKEARIVVKDKERVALEHPEVVTEEISIVVDTDKLNEILLATGEFYEGTEVEHPEHIRID